MDLSQYDAIVLATKEACADALRDEGYMLKRRGFGTLIYCHKAADICMSVEVKIDTHNNGVESDA